MTKPKSLAHEIMVACRRDKRISIERLCMVLQNKYERHVVQAEVTKMVKNGALCVNITVSYSPTKSE